jgi:hypothetical protein
LGVNSSEDEENEVTITNKDPGRNWTQNCSLMRITVNYLLKNILIQF